jgi:hypothetical protein
MPRTEARTFGRLRHTSQLATSIRFTGARAGSLPAIESD